MYEPREQFGQALHFDRRPPLDRYRAYIDELAASSIYNDVSPLEIGRLAREAVLSSDEFEVIETENREFAAMVDFLQAVEAHEQADEAYDAFQSSLKVANRTKRMRSRLGEVPAEKLTREQVANEFSLYEFRTRQLELEQRAIDLYRRALQRCPEFYLQLRERIALTKADIRVALIDLCTRAAERIQDPAERKAELARLDGELGGLIEDTSKDAYGKVCEVQAIYLLRRLVHAADTGHLVSVTHSTPREDLRSDHGAFDLRLLVAGRGFAVDIKAFNAKAQGDAKARQYQTWDKAVAKGEGMAQRTELVRLDPDALRLSSDVAVTQPDERLSLDDKRDALKPLLTTLANPNDRAFFALFGLTEEALQAEKERLSEARDAWEQVLAVPTPREIREREIAEVAQREAEERAEAARREQKRLEDEAELRRQEERAQHERARQASESRRMAEDAARIAREEAVAARAAERELASKRSRAAKKGVETRLRNEREKRVLTIAAWPRALRSIGLLSKDWSGDALSLAAAKETFIRLFALQKKTPVRGFEVDVNEVFSDIFPSDEAFASPSEDALERVRDLMNSGRV